jgi:hypothetical protein
MLESLPVSPSLVEAVNTKYILKFDKAETRLGYKPLYDYHTSVKRTKTYFDGETGQLTLTNSLIINKK